MAGRRLRVPAALVGTVDPPLTDDAVINSRCARLVAAFGYDSLTAGSRFIGPETTVRPAPGVSVELLTGFNARLFGR